jgi:hypothetical protein
LNHTTSVIFCHWSATDVTHLTNFGEPQKCIHKIRI